MKHARVLFLLYVVSLGIAGLTYATSLIASSPLVETDSLIDDALISAPHSETTHASATSSVVRGIPAIIEVQPQSNDVLTSRTEEEDTERDAPTLPHDTDAETRAQESSHTTSPLKTTAKYTPVPFFSQFTDITDTNWKKVGCGIASLAMLIEYYNPGVVSVDTLLAEGVAANAFLREAGWTYAGLIGISKKYGLGGKSHDLAGMSMDTAFETFVDALQDGPVIASVHYTFEPTNPIPHLVVINRIDGDTLYYNDPAETSGNGTLSVSKFKSAWKKRYIEIRPTI